MLRIYETLYKLSIMESFRVEINGCGTQTMEFCFVKFLNFLILLNYGLAFRLKEINFNLS